jgi:hypothetical protein
MLGHFENMGERVQLNKIFIDKSRKNSSVDLDTEVQIQLYVYLDVNLI